MSDPLLLTMPGRHWNSSTVTNNLGVDSDGKLGFGFYTGTWPSYINDGSYNAAYTALVASPSPENLTPDQKELIRYYLSHTSGTFDGFADVDYRVSFPDVLPIEFSEETWSNGYAQIFISYDNLTAAGDYAATRPSVSTDLRNGTGSQTAFTLSFDPLSESNIEVRIGGVLQDDSTYSLSGTTLTFNSAPAAGTNNISININNGYYAGDIILDNSAAHTSVMEEQLDVGDAGSHIILHELAHAMGLRHADDGAGGLHAGFSAEFDQQFTIMGSNANFTHPDMTGVYATGLQLYDIAALQSLYGRNYAKNYDGTVYNSGTSGEAFGDSNTPFIYTIWDGGGKDVIDVRNYSVRAEIDLRQGHFSSIGTDGNGAAVKLDNDNDDGKDHGNVAIAYYTVIENVIGTNADVDGAGGSTDDHLIGNAWANVLYGLAGDDSIYGDGKSFDGDVGFRGDTATMEADAFIEQRAVNNPWVNSAIDESGDDVLAGGAGNDILYGGYGNDVLHGGLDHTEIDSANEEWDPSNYFGAFDAISHTLDGNDTADYSQLYLGPLGVPTTGTPGITVEIDDYITGQNLVYKSGAGLDELFSIETVVGTAGDDVFTGATPDGTITFEGRNGADTYVFDSFGDTGTIFVHDNGVRGLDTIKFYTWGLNSEGEFTHNYIGLETVGSVEYVKIESQDPDADDPIIIYTPKADILNGVGVEYLELMLNDYTILSMVDVIRYLEDPANAGALNNGRIFWSGNSNYPEIPHTVLGTNDAGGVTTKIVSSSVVSVSTLHPLIIPQFVAEEWLHPFVVKDFSQGGSSPAVTTEIGYETYVQRYSFGGGITADDIRLTGGENGTLYIHLDTPLDIGGLTYAIPDFDTGRTISGVGIYDAALHAEIEASNESGIQRGSGWTYDGEYETTSGMTPISGAVSPTYLLESLEFFDSTSIDLQNTQLTLSGTSGNDYLFGFNTKDDLIRGLDGGDSIKGQGGDDTLQGGAGNDTYVFGEGDGEDIVSDSSGALDAIQFDASISPGQVNYGQLGDDLIIYYGVGGNRITVTGFFAEEGSHIEHVFFSDSTVHDVEYITDQAGLLSIIPGTEGADTLTGDEGKNNIILGLGGNDTLTGEDGTDTLDGGTGADTLTGGTGNDTYNVDDAGDTITEYASEGTELVIGSITYTLGANLENLALTGSANINATGNGGSNTLTGNSGGNTLDGSTGADTMAGQEGNDTYIVDEAGDVVTEETGEGTDLVQSSLSYTLGDNLENLTLSGSTVNGTGNSLDNVITGSSSVNTLSGLDGNDTLIGGAGADTLIGGTGDDVYVVDAADVITESASEGTDLVQTDLTYTLASLENVEQLALTGSSNVNGTGNSAVNVITGNSGNNTLNGAAGADVLIGGAGNDTYVVDNAGDAIFESPAEGVDTVQATVSHTLSDNVENLVLSGTTLNGTGNALDNTITGTSSVNTLSGLDGNDTLSGGSGADRLIGGSGDDVFIVDNLDDVIIESSGEGIDLVQSSNYHNLAANVENLTLTGTDNISGAGNSGVNTIIGNSGNNLLNGAGAADTLIGGLGNDFYIVDDTGDLVIENTSEGSDLISASVTFTLSDNVERLSLSGTGHIDGTGNATANTLTGNIGNNTLDGGAGADTLEGDTGNDTYIVDNANDVVIESVSSGTDQVLASTSYTLSSNIEQLNLMGSANIDGTGSSGANTITGNSGNNTLNGAGGSDTLIGGAGDDTYLAGSTIVENSAEGTDTVLSNSGYTLAAANVENVTLTGSFSVNATGSSSDNTITGNSGNNSLDGGGGTDTLIGGSGNDTYVVDDSADVVMENSAEGTDTVRSSATNFTLSSDVENLVLTGSGNYAGTGNASANTMTGNSGDNTLEGMGGNDTLDGSSGADTLSGGDGNDTLDGSTGNDSLAGDDGDDTFVVDSATDVVTDNSGSDIVLSSASFTLGTGIESLTLTGSSTLNGTGNSAANVITGNSGSNTLDGAGGADTLNGGAGSDVLKGGSDDDTYIVDSTGDTITENSGEGTDVVHSSVTFSIAAVAHVENLTLTGGSALTATGSSGNNVLTGNGAGSSLVGGSGNDSYYVGSGDVVSEGASAGTDTVYSGLTSYTLGTNVENLVLTGSGDYNGTGNTLGNSITGNSGNNSLDGGTGTDTLIGGAGNDTYLINVTADIVTENAAEGTDTVITSVTGYTLAANVENLTLGGSVATGTGNGDNNTLTGNSAANTLNGGAGADVLDGLSGNDAMNGGLGDDVFYIDSSSDNANENSSEGTDTVYASVTYAMNTGNRVNVENLILTGASNINGTGNGLANSLTGNTGNNTLDGGSAADVLIGGTGDDTYLVDDAGDAITENASEGTDAVQASLSWTLGSNLENLTLSGSSNIHGTGNASNNTITGNTGANSLSGGDGHDLLSGSAGIDTLVGGNGNDTLDGGTGNDTLDGGDGDDVYEVDSASDTIADSSGTDEVQSSVTYTLATGLENLTLTGTTISGTGNSANNSLVGSGSVNTLTGLDGSDTIDGGAGADSMIGGTGDDVYYISVTTDKVIESASEGTDTVIATVTGYTLAANVENLVLSGSVAAGMGNTLDNVITGNASNNTMTGDDGNDTMNGMAGNDTLNAGSGSTASNDLYIFTAGLDTINEQNTGGTDTLWITGGTTINDITTSQVSQNAKVVINSSVDEVTITNFHNVSFPNYIVERITFDDGFTTTLNDHLSWTSGTGSADTLTGNSSHNVIIGKAGSDTLDGAGGDDDIHGGTGNDVVKGGAGTDLLHGGTGDDSLYGQDGLDTMFGGVGLDTFVFEAATAYNNVDVIKDFSIVTDDDVLDIRDLLTGYNPGTDLLTDFVKIEDSGADSILSIDRDGTGITHGWTQVATLSGITGLTNEAALVSGGNLLVA